MTTPTPAPAPEPEQSATDWFVALLLDGPCEWFALCANPATDIEPHPILGAVPICARCQKRARA